MKKRDCINKDLFVYCNDNMINIIDSSKIPQKEKDYRKRKLNSLLDKMIEENKIDYRYYSLIHEIKSLKFLSKFSDMRIANDYNSEAGCDFSICGNYNIECVTSSPGDDEKNGLNKFYGEGVFNYTEKENIILTRILQSLTEKKDFYEKHLNKSIKDDEPYIIFLSPGQLSYGSFWGHFGFALNKALLGVDHEVFLFDKETHKFTGSKYQYRENIIKHNNAIINCNFFSEENKCISAIIFTTAVLDEYYTKDNTFIFVNPFAKNKININKFQNLVYWKIDKNNHYIPRYNGKDISNRIKRNMF